MRLAIFFVLVLFPVQLFPQSKTWYVSTAAKVTVNGVEKATVSNLQEAFDRAASGDKILIFPGTYEAKPQPYVEPLCGNCQNHRTEVKATRGFLVKDKALTIEGSGTDSTVLVTKAGYGLLFEDSWGSTLTGVKITGGVRDFDGAATDAGIVARASRVTISNCEISDNVQRPESIIVGIGGIMGRENSELFILNNRIINNTWDGIALYRGAVAFIADNRIEKGRGAGIGITWDAVATVLRNDISGFWKGIGTFGTSRAVVRNNAVHHQLGWGIIAIGQSFMEATNNVVYRNGNCGLAVWESTAVGTATNNIVAFNGWRKEWVCPCVGIWGGEGTPRFEISHNAVWKNEAGDWEGIPDSLKKLNLVLEPGFADTLTFRLNRNSLLIDKGDSILTDPDGSRSDLGIWGGPAAPVSKKNK